MLESYGVFQCATCGRVNADGEPIPDGWTEAPAVVQTGSATFAAPPKDTTPIAVARPPLPRFLLAMIVIEAVLQTAAAAGPGGSILRLLFRYTVLGGLLTGHKGAYRYSLLGLTVGLVFGGIASLAVWPHINLMARLFVGLMLGIDAAFFVALLSDDSRRHFGFGTER